MRVIIKPTYQIQRIHQLQNQLSALREIDAKQLMKRPHPKAWCAIEVVEHMIVSQATYTHKMDVAIAQLKPIEGDNDAIPTRAMASYLIKRFPPKDGKIRLKMKTSKQFKPMLDVEQLTSEKVNEIMDNMSKSLDQLLGWVEQTRKKDVLPVRFNSAIGPIVKFNVSEASEFILCHTERHFFQISNVLKAIKER